MGKPVPPVLTMRNTDSLIPGVPLKHEEADIVRLRNRIAEFENSAITLLVDPALIDRSPFQPRKYFCPIEQARLNADINEWGVLSNLIVRVVTPGRYELIAGERRQLGALATGKKVPIKVMELSDSAARKIALSENLNRVDLNPIEETWAILNLLVVELNLSSIDEATSLLYSLDNISQGKKATDNVISSSSQHQIILSILNFNLRGMTLVSFIRHRLPLLKLPDDVADAILQGLEYTKAVSIAKLEDPLLRADLLRSAIDEEMPLTEIKKQIKSLKPTADRKEITPKDRLRSTFDQAKKTKIWENPEKWEKAQQLLSQLDVLLSISD